MCMSCMPSFLCSPYTYFLLSRLSFHKVEEISDTPLRLAYVISLNQNQNTTIFRLLLLVFFKAG